MNETEPMVCPATTAIRISGDRPIVGELSARRLKLRLTFQESMSDNAPGTADAVQSEITKTRGAADAARDPRDHG
jgi:hypothetical protein